MTIVIEPCRWLTWGWILLWALGFAPAAWAEDTPSPGLRPETLSASGYHTCGLKSDGTVACWGAGTTNTGNFPNVGQSIPPTGIFTQVSAGGYHTCGLQSDGTVACWGSNNFGQATPPTGIFTQIDVGYWYACGLKNDGTVACWGVTTTAKSTRRPAFSPKSAWVAGTPAG